VLLKVSSVSGGNKLWVGSKPQELEVKGGLGAPASAWRYLQFSLQKFAILGMFLLKFLLRTVSEIAAKCVGAP